MKRKNPIDRETEKILKELYPGEAPGRRYKEYRRKKIIIMSIIMIIGIGATVCVHFCSRNKNRLVEGPRLPRNEWGEGNYTVVLRGTTNTEEGETCYEVKERSFRKEELENLKTALLKELPELIAGENESLTAVNKNLNLISEAEGYPFSLVWQSSDYERIRTDGKVNTANLPQEGIETVLSVTGIYEDEKWEDEIRVRLIPAVLSPREQYLAAMEEELRKNDLLYLESNEIILPEKIEGEEVVWEEKENNNSILLLPLSVIGAVAASLFMDRDLKKRREKRSRELIRSYPEFVSRLQLYVGAGLNVKNSFLRIGKEYRLERAKTGKKCFLYEEILICNYGFLNGRPENEMYLEWGKRCGEMKYRKLSFLLISHLRQGNEKILSLLSQETDLAMEERRNTARKRGEEAGTKLLFPMIMMLVVVMFLILLPAFSGFGTS